MTAVQEVQVLAEGSAPRLVLTGEIDVSVAAQVVAAGQQVLAARPEQVIVDLSGATFLDSAGIGALVTVSNAAADAGGTRLALRPGPHNVMRVLQIVGLADMFDPLP
jgi:anti-sigma B factor antagonist